MTRPTVPLLFDLVSACEQHADRLARHPRALPFFPGPDDRQQYRGPCVSCGSRYYWVMGPWLPSERVCSGCRDLPWNQAGAALSLSGTSEPAWVRHP